MAYLIHAIVLNASLRRRYSIIENGHTLVRFLSVCRSGSEMKKEEIDECSNISFLGFTFSMNSPLKIGVRVTGDSELRKKKCETSRNYECSNETTAGMLAESVYGAGLCENGVEMRPDNGVLLCYSYELGYISGVIWCYGEKTTSSMYGDLGGYYQLLDI